MSIESRGGRAWIGVAALVGVVAGAIVVRRASPASASARREPHADTAARVDPGFRFVDVTAKEKITFVEHEFIGDARYTDMIGKTSQGSGVAIADFDGDGRMDIFLVDAGPATVNHLYLNRHGTTGGFEEAAAAWGIAATNQAGGTLTPVVIDYDNDGRPDLYLARMGCSMLFHNTGRRFEDVSKASGVTDCRNSQTALPIDFDNDGKQDLYVVRFWQDLDYQHLSRTDAFPENNADARNGGRNTLYRNRGDGTFEDVTDKLGGGDTGWAWDATFGDLAGDGVMRIHIANDWGPDKMFAVRDGRLVDDSSERLEAERRNGMNSSLVDVEGDGRPAVYVSNIYVDSYVHKGNYLWRVPRDGKAEDAAEARGLDKCGWNWGAGAADFDLDGRQDIVVADGMITGTGSGSFEFSAATVAALPGQLSSDVRTLPNLGDKSYAGRQYTCVFSNRGDRFAAVSAQVGITESWDGRAVGLVDFDDDGAEDVIVTARTGRPRLFHTETSVGKKWISVRLRGTKSNREGAGAVVKVSQGDRGWYRWATGGRTGFGASSDPRLHFGIPQEGRVAVEIRWPSGVVDTIADLATGKAYTVVEGEGVAR